MRKHMIYTFLMLLSLTQVFSQEPSQEMARRMIDSSKKVLETAKGNQRIDCLNLLAECYYWIWDEDRKHLDSACMYSDESYELARKSKYKKGLGYATSMKAHCFGGKVDKDRNNNSTEANYALTEKWAKQAIEIGEEIKDYQLIGNIYNMLKWLERWKGDNKKFKENVQKAIFYYEKPITGKITGQFEISRCDQCKGNEGKLGWLYQLLAGITVAEKGSVATVIEQTGKAISYFQKTGSRSSEAAVHMGIANFLLQNLDLKGLAHYKQAISLFHADGDENSELGAYNALLREYWNMGDFENGLLYASESLKLSDKVFSKKPGTSVELGQAYFWTGRMYSIVGDMETAIAYMRKASDHFPKQENWTNHWTIALGEFHRMAGNYDSALFYLVPIANKQNEIAKLWLSNVYISLREYDKALILINEVSPKITGRRDQYPARLAVNTSKIYFAKSDYQKALAHAQQAVVLFNNVGRGLDLVDHYRLLSDIYNKLGNSDSAYVYLKKYSTLKDSLFNRQLYIRLNNYKKQAEEEKRTGHIKLLEQENLIKSQLLRQQVLLKEQNETQLSLLDKDNEIKTQQLQIKDQKLKEQSLIQDQKQSQFVLLDNENRLKDQKLKQQAFIKNALLAGLFLLLLMCIFIYRSLSLKRKNERLQNDKRQAELQQKATQLEMQALRAQMNPHFIFNCLSSINKFILKNDSDTASDYLTRFSRLIRLSLTNSQLSLIPLSDEVEMLRLYLDMERLRFSDNFDYSIVYENTIEPEMIYLPPMLLQPFCENAIWHGLMHKEGQSKLEVAMSLRDNRLQCIITDNGIGREKAAELKTRSATRQKSLGLKITTERLALFNNEKVTQAFYKTDDVLDAKGKVAGTKVTLHIKFKEVARELIKETV